MSPAGCRARRPRAAAGESLARRPEDRRRPISRRPSGASRRGDARDLGQNRPRSGAGSMPSARASAAVPPAPARPRKPTGGGGRKRPEMPLQSCVHSRDRSTPSVHKARHYIHGIRELHRQRHHRSRRARARPQASRHVHRRRRLGRAAPPRLGNPRQRRRRGDERLRLEHPRHAARGRLVDHDRGRRPRHSGRQAPDDEEERARGDLHRAARRRQVRARQLQDGRRPARRRRQRRQRAVEGAGRHRQARRRAVGDALQAGQAGRPAEEARRRRAAPARRCTSIPTRRSFRRSSSTPPIIRERLEVASYLHKGVKVAFEDEATKREDRLRARRRASSTT